MAKIAKLPAQDIDRDGSGKFANGNKASVGHGRPPRQVESEYLRVVAQACDLDVWREIVSRAVQDAKSGDAKAREFLARWIMPANLTLTELTARDETGSDMVDERIKAIKRQRKDDEIFDLLGGYTD